MDKALVARFQQVASLFAGPARTGPLRNAERDNLFRRCELILATSRLLEQDVRRHLDDQEVPSDQREVLQQILVLAQNAQDTGIEIRFLLRYQLINNKQTRLAGESVG